MKTALESQPYQLIMPLAIYSASDISPTSRLILTEIFNLFKAGNKHCYASNGHFAQMFNLKRTTVSMCIRQLEKTGWIISKPYKICEIENCSLKDSGWHRHIAAGDTLSKILDSLSNHLDTLSNHLDTLSNSTQHKNNIENNIENNNNVAKNGFLKKLPNRETDTAKIAYLTDFILTALGDKHSRDFYKLVASKVPEAKIREALAEIKVDGADNPPAMFTYKIRKWATFGH